MGIIRSFLAATAAILCTTAAGAITIAEGHTTADGSAGITSDNPMHQVTASGAWYDNTSSIDGTTWVWYSGALANSNTFWTTFNFTLTGAQTASAQLDLLLAYDNHVLVTLNGSEIYLDNQTTAQAYNQLNPVTASGPLLTDGLNTVEIFTYDVGSAAGLYARYTVTAVDLPPVPVPTGLPLMVGAAGLLALMGKRRKT